MTKTRPLELAKFHNALMRDAPKDYEPYYFPVLQEGKAPDAIEIAKKAGEKCWICKAIWVYDVKLQRWKCPICDMGKASWTSPQARLTIEEAIQRLKQSGNIGISARSYDPLIIIDIDSYAHTNQMLDTLIVRSRKRYGLHGFCFTKEQKRNIPTEKGELRSSDQYVVAAGSYVSTTKEGVLKEMQEQNIPKEIQEKVLQDENLGVYTIEQAKPPITITYKELPQIFLEQAEKTKAQQEKAKLKTETIKPTGKHSALFDLTINDVVSISKARVSHPLHSSETGQNFSIKNELGFCWRHGVSLNALQFLVVKSGYKSCQEAGTGTARSGAGSSAIKGDDGAIFHAWLQAKKDNLIPKDDPIPVKAMKHVAVKHGLIPSNYEGMLPTKVYNRVIEFVEAEKW